VLAQPTPSVKMLYVTAAWRYARGLAFTATGRPAEAARELAAIQVVLASVPADRTVAGFFKMADLVRLASETLAGEMAARAGDVEAAVKHLAFAVRLQDEHWFTEPPPWHYPVRQSLGAALLQAGRAAEAEAVYREDLRRNPENGWSLFGLAQSLRAQAKPDAAAVDARFSRAWARADVRLTSSRF
jgi:tetratricopeptide (TPR) repeat protein